MSLSLSSISLNCVSDQTYFNYPEDELVSPTVDVVDDIDLGVVGRISGTPVKNVSPVRTTTRDEKESKDSLSYERKQNRLSRYGL